MRWSSWLSAVVVMAGSTSLWGADGVLPGSGTEGDPYIIEDLADFDEFADSANAAIYWASGVYTKLACDPNLADRTYTTAVIAPDTDNTNDPWVFDGPSFSGVFDGDDHVISNLTIDTAGAGNDYLGLFGSIEGDSAEVKDLGMENINITGGDGSGGLGGLCGSNYHGTISNCYSGGSVAGGDESVYVGGLCGSNYEGTITDCYSGGSVTGGGRSYELGALCGGNVRGTITNCYSGGSVTGGDSSGAVGGLCGYNNGTISNCYSSGWVSGGYESYNLGSLCGYNNGGTITNCYSGGSVTGGDYSGDLGGLCGGNVSGTITNCYSGGSVNGAPVSFALGGLCGWNWDGTISNCYSTGSVNGGVVVDGLCGDNDGGTITNCFWDVDTSGIGSEGDDNYGATGKTTEQMQTESTFTDANWDFTNESTNGTADIWRLCIDGTAYPRLASEFGSDYSCPDGVSIEDLLYLSSRWLESEIDPYTSADRTGDGKVTIEDYALLAEQWTSQ